MSSKVLLALATLTFLATSCHGYPGGFLDGLPGGIATRQKCPPKPPTIKEFNATEVGNGSFILITKKESDSELIFLRGSFFGDLHVSLLIIDDDECLNL